MQCATEVVSVRKCSTLELSVHFSFADPGQSVLFTLSRSLCPIHHLCSHRQTNHDLLLIITRSIPDII
jgi:hypothetical protein